VKKLLFIFMLSAASLLYSTVIEEIYYIVNDDVISRLDFTEYKANISNSAAAAGKPIPSDQTLISNMIFNLLIQQKAEEEDISISGTDVSNQLKWQIKEWGLENFAQLRAALRQQNTPYAVFYNNMKNNMYKQKLMSKLSLTSDPSAYQLKKYYDENKDSKFKITNSIFNISRILFENSDELSFSQRGKMRQRLKELHKKIKQKELTFQEACRLVNKKTNQYTSAEDLGWVLPRNLQMRDPYIYEKIASLEEGEISAIIDGKLGTYLVKVNEVKSSGYLPFPLIKANIKNYLMMEQRSSQLQAKLDQFIRRSLIVKKTSYFKDFSFY